MAELSSKLSTIGSSFTRWLNRYVPPNHMRADAEARRDEIDAMLRMLSRYAPSDGTERWMDRVTDRLDSMIVTAAWPRVKQIEEACMALRREDADAAPRRFNDGEGSQFKLDSFAIAAKRMQAGEAVGEGFLWGRNAVVLLRRGLVTRQTIEDYRQGAINSRAENYPSADVSAWVHQQEEIHTAALTSEDGATRDRREKGSRFSHAAAAARIVPDKTSPHKEYQHYD